MGSIGGYGVIRLEGTIHRPRPVLKDITRDGADGFAVQDVGYRAEPSTLKSSVDVNAADRVAAEAAYMDLIGCVITLINDWGDSYIALVKDAEILTQQELRGAVGGLSTGKDVLLEARWVVQVIECL